jgi:hypothetical protein
MKLSRFKCTLFGLGMFTYTYERQDIIQIALKLTGGGFNLSIKLLRSYTSVFEFTIYEDVERGPKFYKCSNYYLFLTLGTTLPE